MSTARKLMTSQDKAFARLGLRRYTADVIDSLPGLEEAEILCLRANAKTLGVTAWKIEAACDHELYERARAAPARNGRGNRDLTGVGVKSAVAKRAKDVGCTPRTIEKNAQIYRLMTAVENSVSGNVLFLLDEKGFYTAALTAADPQQALLDFAERKQSNPHFRVSEAYRLLDASNATKVYASNRAQAVAQDRLGVTAERQRMSEHIRRTMDLIRNQVIPDCPDPDFAERIYGSLLEELEDHNADVFDEDAEAGLRLAWDKGHRTEDQMVIYTGYPRDVVQRTMQNLEDQGDFRRVHQGGVIDSSGRRKFIWHRIGEVMGDGRRGL